MFWSEKILTNVTVCIRLDLQRLADRTKNQSAKVWMISTNYRCLFDSWSDRKTFEDVTLATEVVRGQVRFIFFW